MDHQWVQWLANLAFTIAGGIGGIVLKTLWTEIKGLQDGLSKLRESITETYVRRDDFRDHADRVEQALLRIEAKFDRKADKP